MKTIKLIAFISSFLISTQLFALGAPRTEVHYSGKYQLILTNDDKVQVHSVATETPTGFTDIIGVGHSYILEINQYQDFLEAVKSLRLSKEASAIRGYVLNIREEEAQPQAIEDLELQVSTEVSPESETPAVVVSMEVVGYPRCQLDTAYCRMINNLKQENQALELEDERMQLSGAYLMTRELYKARHNKKESSVEERELLISNAENFLARLNDRADMKLHRRFLNRQLELTKRFYLK